MPQDMINAEDIMKKYTSNHPIKLSEWNEKTANNVIGNKSNLSKIVYIMIWNSVCWKFYSFNWGTNKKQNC